MISAASGIIAIAALYFFFFSAPSRKSEANRFVVTLGASRQEVAQSLKSEGFVRSAFIFRLIHPENVAPGGYRLAPDMNVFRVSRALSASSYMAWVSIPEGSTKAEVANLLSSALEWTDAEEKAFLAYDVPAAAPLTEGVYFPTTYLLPRGESVASTTARIYAKFNEVFAPYAEEALQQNIKWTTVIRFASLIQAEAAGPQDMQLIAGILWNRLLSGMRLQVDAASSTYAEAGLPAQPIDNPGLPAIDAVLHPRETDCRYYLHDPQGVIHCAVTYAGQKANVEKYLRGR